MCKELYKAAKAQQAEQPNSKHFDFNARTLAPTQASVNLVRVYKEHYKAAKAQLAEQPKSKQFDFDEQAIFLKLDLFTKRLNKLIDMFTTIHQFSTLEQHKHIEGLEQVRGCGGDAGMWRGCGGGSRCGDVEWSEALALSMGCFKNLCLKSFAGA